MKLQQTHLDVPQDRRFINLSIMLCHVECQLPWKSHKIEPNSSWTKVLWSTFSGFSQRELETQSTFIHTTLFCNRPCLVDGQLLRILSDQILINSSSSWTSYESSHLYGNYSSSVLQCHHKSKDNYGIIKSGKTAVIVSSINKGNTEGVEHWHMFFRNSVSKSIKH